MKLQMTKLKPNLNLLRKLQTDFNLINGLLKPVFFKTALQVMENTNKKYKQFTIRFLDRSIRFLSYSVLALTVLYFSGSIQDFLDSNLFLILNIVTVFYILLALFSISAVLIKAFYIIFYKEKKYIFLFIVDIFLFLLSISAAVFFSFLMITAKGNI